MISKGSYTCSGPAEERQIRFLSRLYSVLNWGKPAVAIPRKKNKVNGRGLNSMDAGGSNPPVARRDESTGTTSSSVPPTVAPLTTLRHTYSEPVIAQPSMPLAFELIERSNILSPDPVDSLIRGLQIGPTSTAPSSVGFCRINFTKK